MKITPRRNTGERDELPWSAMRCRRLLRPLQTRLTALDKLLSVKETSISPASEQEPCRSSLKRPSRDVESANETHRHQKRQRRTYSQKGFAAGKKTTATATGRDTRSRHSGSRTKQVGSNSIPSIATPLLRRTTAPDPLPQDQRTRSSSHLKQESRDEALARSLRLLAEMRPELGEAQISTCEGILRTLSSLLLATAAVVPSRGPRSLASMCLRQVPKYIRVQDELEKSEAEEEGNLSTFATTKPSIRIYDELEALGCEGRGWKGLPVLLRAHALSMLKEAIVSGSIRPRFAYLLAKYYQLAGFDGDAWEIASVVTQRQYPRPQHHRSTLKEDQKLEPLAMTADLATSSPCAVRPCQAVIDLIKSHRLPSGWLSTRAFQFYWIRSAGSLLGDSASTYSLRNLVIGVSALCSSCGHSESNINMHHSTRALVAVVGAVVAMALLSRNTLRLPHDATLERHYDDRVYHRVLHVLRAALQKCEDRVHEDAIGVLKLGVRFVSTVSNDGSQHIPKTLDLRNAPHLSGDMAIALACSVARCVGKAVVSPPNQIYALLCDQLETLRLAGIDRLRQDGAFMLARDTDDLRDLAFAESGRSFTSSSAVPCPNLTARRQSAFTGYRWEAGISEWVVDSPPKQNSSTQDTNKANLNMSRRGLRQAESAHGSTDVPWLETTKSCRNLTNTLQAKQALGSPPKTPRHKIRVLAMPDHTERWSSGRGKRLCEMAGQENRAGIELHLAKGRQGSRERTSKSSSKAGRRVVLATVRIGQMATESDDELMA